MKNINTTNIMPVSVLASIITHSLENPPISRATRDREPIIESSNQHGKILKTRVPSSGANVGSIARKLSFHDREDVAQEILACLVEHGLMPQGKRFIAPMLRAENVHEELRFSGGGHCIADLSKEIIIDGKKSTVWQLLFSRCRKLLKFDQKMEKGKVYLETLTPEKIGEISLGMDYKYGDSSHVRHEKITHPSLTYSTGKNKGKKQVRFVEIKTTSPKRKALASDAMLLKKAIFKALEVDTSRQKKSKFKKAHAFLRASIATVQGKGHGFNQMTRKERCDKKVAFKQFVAIGLESLKSGKVDNFTQLAQMFHASKATI
jgi:hypothetical protein